MMADVRWFDVVQLLFSAGTALGGALLGARIGISQLRSERALDRRLNWHERAFRGIMQLRMRAATLRISLRTQPQGRSDLFLALHALNEELDTVLAERFLYAPPQSMNAIEELLGEMNKFGSGDHTATNPQALLELDQVAARVLLPLANAMRSELKWEALGSGVSTQHLGTDTPASPKISKGRDV